MKDMYIAFGRKKGSDNWSQMLNFGEMFSGEKCIMELMIEKMKELYPNNEYKIEEV